MLKNHLVKEPVEAVDENIPFTVETNAAYLAIAAALSQAWRHVAFHFCIFQGSEQCCRTLEGGGGGDII